MALWIENDLNVITAEINSYKQVAGQAIFEIGKRLKHVKENDLVYGEWTNYCENTLDISLGYANRYIKVYEELGNTNMYTSIGLGQLYHIATLPQEEREKEHVTSKGEKKTGCHHQPESSFVKSRKINNSLKFNHKFTNLLLTRLKPMVSRSTAIHHII